MTKFELVESLIPEFGTRTAAEKAVTEVFRKLPEALQKEDDTLAIPGFGTFKVVKRQSRPGRNPRTGEPIVIPERLVIQFSQSKKKTFA